MNLFLTRISTLAVILHLTFGCGWHHGIAGAHECDESAHAICAGDHGAHAENSCDHRHSHSKLQTNFLVEHIDEPDRSQHHDHSACLDDSCPITQITNPVSLPTDFAVEYLGGVENCSLIDAAIAVGSDCDPFPDFSATGKSMRAHLALGVLTL